MSGLDAIFPPAVAAISLGIFGRAVFSRRIGRNEAFNHLGNTVTAIVAGIAGYLIAPVAVLWVVVVLALASAVAVYTIDGNLIDHELARGADDGNAGDEPKRLRRLLENRPLLFFTAAITLFHFANAAMLPLLGEKLSQGHQEASSLFMAACIIAAQVVMVPMALLVGHKADAWGRKPLFLAGFAVLPVRGLLYLITQNPYLLVSIQALDGIGAGIFGALFFLVVADLTRGTGHYNLALGASGACWGLGAAFSNGVAGLVVDAAGYSAAFLFLAGCAHRRLSDLLARCAGNPQLAEPAALGSRGDFIGGSRLSATTTRRQRVMRHAGWLSITSVVIVVALALVAAAVPFVMPSEDVPAHKLAAAVIFTASYLALAIGKIPGLSIDRAGVALVGACLMVASGVLPLENAYKAIDIDTITLLLGMMIIVANLRLSGFFAVITNWVMRHMHGPLTLLAAVTVVSGIASAFLVNDATCLILAPLVLELSLSLKRNPLPYLLAVAMASNAGSVATITGNPQNIMIGSFSGIPYAEFSAALAPVAIAGLVVTIVLIALQHRQEFRVHERVAPRVPRVRINRVLMLRALAATVITIALFFAGQPPAKAAIIVGALLLLTRRIKSARVYADIDWSLLLMFTGLFIIVAGAQHALLTPNMVSAAGRLHLGQVPALAAATAVLSNLVSNVPAVLVMRPFVDALPDHRTAWLVIAMASTLAGNFIVLGSVANLIVVEKAAARGVPISAWAYFRVGGLVTIITLTLGTLWLWR